jgi:hypothetical protein
MPGVVTGQWDDAALWDDSALWLDSLDRDQGAPVDAVSENTTESNTTRPLFKVPLIKNQFKEVFR